MFLSPALDMRPWTTRHSFRDGEQRRGVANTGKALPAFVDFVSLLFKLFRVFFIFVLAPGLKTI